MYRSEGLNSWLAISNSTLASTLGKRSRRDAPSAAAEASCMKHGKDKGVMDDEGLGGASEVWAGGVVAGIF